MSVHALRGSGGRVRSVTLGPPAAASESQAALLRVKDVYTVSVKQLWLERSAAAVARWRGVRG